MRDFSFIDLRIERKPMWVVGGEPHNLCSTAVSACMPLGSPHALLLCEKPRPPAWGAGLGKFSGSFSSV